MLKMVDGTGIIGVDMVCPLGGAVSPPQPNYDKVEVEGGGSLMLPNSLDAPLERLELIGNSTQGENPAPDNPQEIRSAGRLDETSGKYLIDMKITGKNLISDTVGFKVGSFNYNTGVNASLPDRGRLKEYIPIAPGKKYLVTVNGNTSIDDIGVHFLDINRFPVAGYGSARFISPLNAYYVRIRYKGWTENDKVSLQLQDTSLDYEPYTEQTVQIALDEPLRGIGEYKDTITKDGVVRKILEAPLVKYLKPVINGNVGNRYVFAETPNANINYDRKRCMSNIGFTNNAEKKKYVPHPYQTNFLIRIADDDTIDAVREKMKDVIVAYTVKEPITEPLPESVQAQLSALHSENGVTHVFVDSGEVPCGIKLTYRKEI